MSQSETPVATAQLRGESPVVSLRTGILLAFVGMVVFAWGVPTERVFPDETAYVTQTYFLDLVMPPHRNDWAWVEYHAYDLPPLPKYIFGVAEKLAGFPLPDRRVAGRWFQNIRQPLVSWEMIFTARWPVVLLGGLGVAAIYALASLGTGNSRVGMVAALLLILDPLFRLHARRAMSDVPAEALTLATEAVALAAWCGCLAVRPRASRLIRLFLATGICLGLATLSKLTGFSAAMVLGAWCVLMLVFKPAPASRRIAFAMGTVLALGVAGLSWLVLNPYLTVADPQGPAPANFMGPLLPEESVVSRFMRMLKHRVQVSSEAQKQFPHDALPGLPDKLAAVAVQGFGRFGPLGRWDHDSTVPYPRFAWDRDAGATVWLPCVVAGLATLWWRGKVQVRAGQPPAGWALLAMCLVSTTTILFFIPLAWDRYYLPMQSPAIVAGASFLVWLWERLVSSVRSPRVPA